MREKQLIKWQLGSSRIRMASEVFNSKSERVPLPGWAGGQQTDVMALWAEGCLEGVMGVQSVPVTLQPRYLLLATLLCPPFPGLECIKSW